MIVPDSRRWLPLIQEQFDGEILEALIREQPRTGFHFDVPPDLAFLKGGFVDLGFQYLGLPKDEEWALFLAFSDGGVAVPGTHWRLRNYSPLFSVVELADGTEAATLPWHWKEGVLIDGRERKWAWIGKRVLNRWSFDLSGYRNVGEAWVPV